MDDHDYASEAKIYRLPLLMVATLHARGFERLRAYPMLAPSGFYWRCNVGPSCVAQSENGALISHLEYLSPLVAHYTSGAMAEYYGIDGEGLSASQLATTFAERYPQIVEAASGKDPEYVKWFTSLLNLTDPGLFPYAAADYEIPEDRLPYLAIGPTTKEVILPLPPPSLDAGQC